MTRTRRNHPAALLALMLGAVLPVGGLAAETGEQTRAEDAIILTGHVGAGHSGRLAVNIIAGSRNQQASSAILAVGGAALTHGRIVQHADGASADRTTRIAIGPGAFAGISGLASINITAGTQNQSANLAALAIGQTGALSDQLLSQTRAPTEPNGGTAPAATGPNDVITIADDAFGQGSGLFQGNLIGGERNSSANTFSLTVAVGGQP